MPGEERTRGAPRTRAGRRGDGALREVRFVVVERLRAREGELEESVFARVRDEVPHPVSAAEEEYFEGLHAAVKASVDYVLTGIELASMSGPIPVAALMQARRAARAGVGLDTVLRRYLVGHTLLADQLMREAESEDVARQRAPLRGLMGTSASLLDRLLPPVTSAYRDEIARARRTRVHLALGRATARAPRSTGFSAISQRERIVEAAVYVVAQRGYGRASVGAVIERARVSRRTFYEQFDSLDDCLLAAMDGALRRIGTRASDAFDRQNAWPDGVRESLAVVLAYFDSDPALARVCLVEALAAGPRVRRHRDQVAQAFRAPILARIEREVPHVAPLSAEAAMASVTGILAARLDTEDSRSLIGLLGPLIGILVRPFLDDRATRAQMHKATQLARAIQAGTIQADTTEPGPYRGVVPSPPPPGKRTCAAPRPPSPPSSMPAILANPNAHRARRCLRFLAAQDERGSHPSNGEIATAIGVCHPSQVSRLLAQLHAEDLLSRHSRGRRNAWRLTSHGRRIAQALIEQEARQRSPGSIRRRSE